MFVGQCGELYAGNDAKCKPALFVHWKCAVKYCVYICFLSVTASKAAIASLSSTFESRHDDKNV